MISRMCYFGMMRDKEDLQRLQKTGNEESFLSPVAPRELLTWFKKKLISIELISRSEHNT